MRSNGLQGALLAVADGDLPRGQVVQLAMAFFNGQVDAVDAGGPGAVVQVVPPAYVGMTQLGLGGQHVLPAEGDRCLCNKSAIHEHMHLGCCSGGRCVWACC